MLLLFFDSVGNSLKILKLPFELFSRQVKIVKELWRKVDEIGPSVFLPGDVFKLLQLAEVAIRLVCPELDEVGLLDRIFECDDGKSLQKAPAQLSLGFHFSEGFA